MLERRREPRLRAFLRGNVAFNKRCSTLDCDVRNISPVGALIAIDSTAIIPDEFDLSIPARGKSFRSQMVWRTAAAAGVKFIDVSQSSVIPLNYAVKLMACEREKANLKQRIADLGGG